MAKVLLADDDQDIRRMVSLLLSIDGNLEIVGEAATPDEAVRLAAEHQPDLVVLDQGFRGDLTGTEVAPAIKQAAPACKIVLFTAYDNLAGSVNDVPEIDGFLLKTQVTALVSVINEILAPA